MNQYIAQLSVLIIFKIYINFCLEKREKVQPERYRSSNQLEKLQYCPKTDVAESKLNEKKRKREETKEILAECKVNLDSLKNENGTRESPILYGVTPGLRHIAKFITRTTLIYHTKEEGLYFQYNLVLINNKSTLHCVEAKRKKCPATLELTFSSQGKIEILQVEKKKPKKGNYYKPKRSKYSLNREDPKVRDIKNYTVLTPKQSTAHVPSCGYQLPIQDRVNELLNI